MSAIAPAHADDRFDLSGEYAPFPKHLVGNGPWVYYVTSSANNLIKIGRAKELHARMRNLQTMSPVQIKLLAVEPQTFGPNINTEINRHQQFAKYREHGEWFVFSSEIENHIQQKCIKVDWDIDPEPPRRVVKGGSRNRRRKTGWQRPSRNWDGMLINDHVENDAA